MSDQFHLQKLTLNDGQEAVVQTFGWDTDEPTLKLAIKSKPETIYEGTISKDQVQQIAEALSQEYEPFFKQTKKALTQICPEFTYELTGDHKQFSWSQQSGFVKVIYCSVDFIPSPTLQPFDLLAQAAETHAELKDEANANKLEAELYHHNINQLQSDYSEILEDRVRHEDEQLVKFRDLLVAKGKLIEELEEQLEKYAEERAQATVHKCNCKSQCGGQWRRFIIWRRTTCSTHSAQNNQQNST